MTGPLRIVFMGTPAFAVPALDALVAAGHQVIAVYSQPPRPAGRGQKLQQSPVHQRADSLGIPVCTPKTLKTPESQQEFANHGADVAIVAAYGLILPKVVLDAPKYGCINIHASLLPRWRGASPIHHAIWKGDAQSGVTIMQMDVGLDTGDMLLKGEVPITATTTTPQLHDALSAMGGTLVVDALARIDALTPQKQDGTQSCYAPMLKKDDGRIDWSQSAIEIDRAVRALNPWPGTYATVNGKRLKILEVAPEAGSGKAGTILNRAGHVACGADALCIKRVQPDGGKPMDFAAAVNGGYLKVGDVLA